MAWSMCNWKRLIYVLLWPLLLGAVSCKERTDQRIFRVKGVVKEVLPERRKVKIEHEDIPGYMKPMTMLFDVKGSNQLAGLQPGDSVLFRMVVTKDDGWIDQITKLNTAAASVSAAPDSFRRRSPGARCRRRTKPNSGSGARASERMLRPHPPHRGRRPPAGRRAVPEHVRDVPVEGDIE